MSAMPRGLVSETLAAGLRVIDVQSQRRAVARAFRRTLMAEGESGETEWDNVIAIADGADRPILLDLEDSDGGYFCIQSGGWFPDRSAHENPSHIEHFHGPGWREP